MTKWSMSGVSLMKCSFQILYIWIYKEPYVSTKEPNISATEPCISAKEYLPSNEVQFPNSPLQSTFTVKNPTDSPLALACWYQRKKERKKERKNQPRLFVDMFGSFMDTNGSSEDQYIYIYMYICMYILCIYVYIFVYIYTYTYMYM